MPAEVINKLTLKRASKKLDFSGSFMVLCVFSKTQDYCLVVYFYYLMNAVIIF